MTKGQKIAVGILCGIPLFCCLGGLAVVRGTFGGAAASRDHELALARRDGIPTTPAELSAIAAVPAQQDGWAADQKLFALIGDGKPEHVAIKTVGDAQTRNPSPKQVAAANAALLRVQPALALARQAAAYSRVSFRRDWSKGAKLLLPEFSWLRAAARALCFDAEHRSAGSDWKGALADVAAAQRLGRQAGSDPNVIGMLVQLAIEAMAERELGLLLDAHSRDPEFLAAAKRLHDDFGPLADYRRALCGELVMGRMEIAQLKSIHELDGMDEEGVRRPNPVEATFFQSPIVRDAFDYKLLHAYRQVIDSVPPDPSRWEDAERASVVVGREVEADHSVSNTLNQILFPVFGQAAEAIGVMVTHRNLTETAIRLLQDRARTGRLPQYLPNYGPIRLDPFTGNPLIYRREGSGFILYSVGQDRVDNGGIPRGTSGATGFDEVLRIH